MSLRFALWLPLFDELADARAVTELGVAAEDAGWDGLFVWDHVSWRPPIAAIADPWIALAAVAANTQRLMFGPMVTPLARRRPAKVARETATLAQLGNDRLILGVGLGSDRFVGEFSRLGDVADDRQRAAMLDESLSVLRAAWSGHQVSHDGPHYRVQDITFLPTPPRQTVPVWVAAMPGARRPLQRAARHDGFFPVNITSPAQLADAVGVVQDHRADPSGPFDVAVALRDGTDPNPYAAAGATWALTDLEPEDLRLDAIRGLVRDGPHRG